VLLKDQPVIKVAQTRCAVAPGALGQKLAVGALDSQVAEQDRGLYCKAGMHHTCYLLHPQQNGTVQHENLPFAGHGRGSERSVTKKWYTRVTSGVLLFG